MTTEASWKCRFTPEQLERKRKVDRIGQQKLRRQSTQKTKKLEERLQLAVTGEHSDLVQSLLEENAKLRKAIGYYRSCLRGVEALVKPVLNAGGDIQVDDDFLVASAPGISSRSYGEESVTTQMSSLLRLTRQPSIYYQAKDMSTWDGSLQGADVSVDKLVEVVMLWKLSHNHGVGPRFLEGMLELKCRSGQQSVSDDFQQLILSSRFYEHVYEALTGPMELPTAGDVGPGELVKHMNPKELHKRTITVYAYEALRPYKSYFASLLEWSAIFWSIRIYYEFLTWPTVETLMQVPSYLWPTPSQFSGDHPQFIDFLVWPRIRHFVCLNDQAYDLDELILSLVKNFELRVGSIMPVPPLFQKTAASTDLQLHPKMVDVLYNLDNFSVRDAFTRQYPDLGTDLSGGTGQAISSDSTSQSQSRAANMPAGEQRLVADVVNLSQPSGTEIGNSTWTAASESFIDGLGTMWCSAAGSAAIAFPPLRELEVAQTLPVQGIDHDFDSEAVTMAGTTNDALLDTTWLID